MLLTGIVVSNMATALVTIRRLPRQPQAVCLGNILTGALICRLLLELCFMAIWHLPQTLLERIPGIAISPDELTLNVVWCMSPVCLLLNVVIIIAARRYRKKLSPQEAPIHQTLRLLLRLCPLEMLPAAGVLILPVALPVGFLLLLWLSGQ